LALRYPRRSEMQNPAISEFVSRVLCSVIMAQQDRDS
jgi:hypothetical protein